MLKRYAQVPSLKKNCRDYISEQDGYHDDSWASSELFRMLGEKVLASTSTLSFPRKT